ncbi:MAG: bis(5'-nucleosyl)-tetraphosphatase (symmetrical) YqeK, partial [Clostridia bacterium]|nr:bis(5'-nucleosyl)-tetraphosphatase (symmetrical) YqeK [Clostridia bacterium]
HKGVPEQVMHQYTGAYVAEREFNVSEEDILNAVKYHTSGRADMSPLEKLIFLSDMLEEGRTFEGVNELRALFKKDVDECLLTALKRQIDYLNSKGEKIYEKTIEAYEFLKGTKK